MIPDDGLRADLQALESAAPADLPPQPFASRSAPSSRGAWAAVLAAVVAGVVGSAVIGVALRPTGEPTIGFGPTKAGDDERLTVRGISFVLPEGWSVHDPSFVSAGPAWPVVYFSNQAMGDECLRTTHALGTSERCGLPIDALEAGGILVSWWQARSDGHPVVPPGDPYLLGGTAATRHALVANLTCRAVGPGDGWSITVVRSPGYIDVLTICILVPEETSLDQLESLLASVEFTRTSTATMSPMPQGPEPACHEVSAEICAAVAQAALEYLSQHVRVARLSVGPYLCAREGCTPPIYQGAYGVTVESDSEEDIQLNCVFWSGPFICSPAGRQAPEVPQIGVPYAIELFTHCGLTPVEFDGDLWAIGGLLDDGSGNPPPGFGNPTDLGTVTLSSPNEGVYRSQWGMERTVVRGGERPGGVCF